MRRFFSTCKNYIFVAPIAVAMADDGGCASTKPGPLSAEQVQSVIVGNTIAKVDHEAYAFIDENGEIRGDVRAADGLKQDTGTWTVDDGGQFCVTWQVTIHAKNNCAEFVALEDDQFSWGGHTLNLEDGNPREM